MALLTIHVSLIGDIASDFLDWPDAHDAVLGTVGAPATYYTISSIYVPPDSPDAYYQVSRGCLSFNTTALHWGDTINLITLYMHGYDEPFYSSQEDDAGQAELGIVGGVHGDPLVPADFGNLKDQVTSCGWIQFGDWIPDGWNAKVITHVFVEPEGMTLLGLRLHGDIFVDEPTGINQILIDDKVNLPYLEIDYTPALVRAAGSVHNPLPLLG